MAAALERLISRSGMQPSYSIALRQAQRVRRKAQLLSMLTNIGQYQDQPDESLEDETLPFNAFYMMVIQSQNGQQASKEILAPDICRSPADARRTIFGMETDL